MKYDSLLLKMFCVLLLSAWLAGNAGAQTTPQGVGAEGTAQSSGYANLLRMQITLEAKAADIEQAIELLTQKKKQAVIKLEKLGAVETSITAGDFASGASGDTSAIMKRLKQMLGDDERVERAAKMKPPVSLQVNLTCHWELDSGADPLALLIQCDTLKGEITKAGIGTSDIKDKLTAEQEEILEEMQDLTNEYGNSETETVGTPTFSYVRMISAADQTTLLEEAFSSAKKKAAALAKVAGGDIGDATAVDSNKSSAGAGYYDPYGRNQNVSTTKTLEDGTIEVVSAASPSIKHKVEVSAVFELVK